MEEVKISISPEARFFSLLRTVAASVAARLNLSYDSIDDLRLAVYEAGAFLLRMGTDQSRLSMKFGMLGPEGGLEVLLSISSPIGSSDGPQWPPSDLETTLAWKILSGLTDGAEFFFDEEAPAIRMKIAIPAAGP